MLRFTTTTTTFHKESSMNALRQLFVRRGGGLAMMAATRLLLCAPLTFASDVRAQAPVSAAVPSESPTLDAVMKKGYVSCGVSGGSFGFSLPDSQGEMRGIDADECRAVGAAVFGMKPDAVKFVKVTVQQRFAALQSGEIDLLYANATWTTARETRLGIQFASIHFYDGVGFLVKKTSKASSAKQLDGASVCMLPGGSSDANLQDFTRLNKIKVKPVVISESEELKKAFISGRCDAWVHDMSALASFKAAQGDKADDYVFLPEVLSNEPLGGAVRKNDARWFDIARWTHFALVLAEQYGVTSENVDQMLASDRPEIRRLLGVEGDIGQSLGLDNRWAYNVIKAVGNYSQMWDRTVGKPLGLPRNMNALWRDGGLQYAPPMR
jgi:general L-amino acid transport system substrate-binding protein